MSRILLVDDDKSVLSVLATALKFKGFDVVPSAGGTHSQGLVDNGGFDLMISDVSMKPVSGYDLIKLAHDRDPAMPAILLSGMDTDAVREEAGDIGQFDCLMKPLGMDTLISAIEKALTSEQESAPVAAVTREAAAALQEPEEELIAESAAMSCALQMVKRVAPTVTPVLFVGEAGAGKMTLARELHALSRRSESKLNEIDCADHTESELIEALFAFARGHSGLIATANGGTVVLRNIDGMGSDCQKKLLSYLQDNSITYYNGSDSSILNTRIVTSSLVRTRELVAQGRFIEELSFRLGPITIAVGPLRERRNDILPLVRRFLNRELPDIAGSGVLGEEAEELLLEYSWPGNVKQLRDLVVAVAKILKQGESATDFIRGELR